MFAIDAVLAAFICDGLGEEPEGTPCQNTGDDEAECGAGGACVPTLGSPYGVCNLVSAAELVGTRCQQDADCGSDGASRCVPENRLFVRVDPGDEVSELSEDNNLGWRFLDEGCLPEQVAPVPEPDAVLAMAAALATVAAIRRRRRQ